MGKQFDIGSLILEAHSIKTKNGKIWINMNNGTFIQRESILNNKPRVCTAKVIYRHAKSVISRGELIATRNRQTGLLVRSKKSTKVKNVV